MVSCSFSCTIIPKHCAFQTFTNFAHETRDHQGGNLSLLVQFETFVSRICISTTVVDSPP